MEMINEQQGGARKNPLAGFTQAMGEESVNPFQFVQQPQEEERRRAVPRMPVRMKDGGDARKEEFDQQKEQERQSRLVEQGLSYAMGPMDIRAVRKPEGYEARVSGSFNQVVPYMDFDPLTGTFKPTEVGVSYGQMGPEGGYRFQYGQPLPREGQRPTPPQVTGQYRRQLDRNSEIQASGYYVPIPGAKDQYGAQFRYLQRFADGGQAVSVEAISGYLKENPTLTDRQIAAKMDEFKVSPEQMARATGVGLPEVTARYEATRVDPSTISEDVRRAVQSEQLTMDQYRTLSNYFNNALTTAELANPTEAPTIRDFVNKPRTGFEFASFLATRGGRHGGNNPYGMTLYENLLQPYLNQVNTSFQPGGYEGEAPMIIDPITGRPRGVTQVGENRYRAEYSPVYSGPSGSGETRTEVGLDYVVDPATGRATLASPYLREFTPRRDRGIETLLGIAGTVAGYYFFPGMDFNSMLNRGLITAGTEVGRRLFNEGGEVVYRQSGSPEQGEVANPADIAEQMTVGTLPEGQKPAGQVFKDIGRDVVRGAQYLPYDLIGAPVDIATMAMRPFGYNVEKPFLGSEYLIDKARQAGIAQAPTGSAAETATRIGMGLVNPAAVARQIPKGIATIEKGVETLTLPAFRKLTGNPDATKEQMIDFVLNQKSIVQAGAPAISRAPGGTFFTSEGSNLQRFIGRGANEALDEIGNDPEKAAAVSEMFYKKAQDFFEKRAGSISDELKREMLAGRIKMPGEKGEELFPTYLREAAQRGNISAMRDLERRYDEMLGIKQIKLSGENLTETWAETQRLNQTAKQNILSQFKQYPELIPDDLLFKLTNKDPTDVRIRLKDNPEYFSTVLEPKLMKLINVESEIVKPSDIRQYESAYGKYAAENLSKNELEAIKRKQPLLDIKNAYAELFGYDITDLARQAAKMSTKEINDITFATFVSRASKLAAKQKTLEARANEIQETLRANKAVDPKTLSFGTEVFQELPEGFTWRKIVDPDATVIQSAVLDNSIKGYANYGSYGPFNNGRKALEDGSVELFVLYDKNGIPVTNVEMVKGEKSNKFSVRQARGNGPLTGNVSPDNYLPQIKAFINKTTPENIPFNISREIRYIDAPEGFAKGGMVDKPLYDRAA
jgi:hypothetical protein